MRSLGGRYRLDRKIGEGGMGSVWLAYDATLDRTVAVKLLTAEHSSDPEALERARNEARSGAQFAHPNVIAVYDFGTSRRAGRGAAFLVMELVAGPLLSDRLAAGPLDWAMAGRICAEVSAGLAAAHASGVVHRDIKPANIVLTDSGAKLVDFGVAARIGQPDRLADGTMFGTPAYIAPERFQGLPVAPAADMYGVGVLLFQCLTGHLPWTVRADEELLDVHWVGPPMALPAIDGMPPELAETCTGCLSREPERRPTSTAAALILAAAVETPVYVPPVIRPRAPGAAPAGLDRLHADTVRGPAARHP